MCGIDVHMDPNIGKRLNALGNTLTSLTGEEDTDDITDLNSVNMADLSDEDESDGMSPPIHMVRAHIFYVTNICWLTFIAIVKCLGLFFYFLIDIVCFFYFIVWILMSFLCSKHAM